MSLKRPGDFSVDPYYATKRVDVAKATFKMLCPLSQAGAIIGRGGAGLQVFLTIDFMSCFYLTSNFIRHYTQQQDVK